MFLVQATYEIMACQRNNNGYAAITGSVLSYVGCTYINGLDIWVLDASSDVQCFTGTQCHVDYAWVFACGTVIYVVGIPLLLSFLALIVRERLVRHRQKLPVWYTRCFSKYAAWVTLRKALLSIAFVIGRDQRILR